jgi:hypothetical protein
MDGLSQHVVTRLKRARCKFSTTHAERCQSVRVTFYMSIHPVSQLMHGDVLKLPRARLVLNYTSVCIDRRRGLELTRSVIQYVRI